MKHVVFLFSILLTALLYSCGGSTEGGDSEKSLEEIKQEGPISNADIIRNPVSADSELDTVNVAKMEFEYTEFDFDTVGQGAVVEHTFTFKNTGKEPLLISSARSTCGCTVPEWPKAPVEPGETGEINVRFDTKNKRNRQIKPVTITANTYPNTTRVYLRGHVMVPEENQQ